MHFNNLNIVYNCGLQVFDHDLGTNGTFKLFLEGDKNIFEVRNETKPLASSPRKS